MECYATHIWGWGKIFICCFLLLPPLNFCSVCLSFFVLYSLFGWMFDSTRCSRGMTIRPTNKGINYKERQANRAKTEKFIKALFKKMDSRNEVKFTNSAWKWYYSISREIFSFGKFFVSKHFFKNCRPYCIRGPNYNWGWQNNIHLTSSDLLSLSAVWCKDFLR